MNLDRVIPFRFYGDGCEATSILVSIVSPKVLADVELMACRSSYLMVIYTLLAEGNKSLSS